MLYTILLECSIKFIGIIEVGWNFIRIITNF